MKPGLSLKLGIGILLLFSVVFTGFLLYKPIRYRYWRGKLASEDMTLRNKAIENLIAMEQSYNEWLISDFQSGNRAIKSGAAIVLANTGRFDYGKLDKAEFMDFAEAVTCDLAVPYVPAQYYEQIKTRLFSSRPRVKDRRYYDSLYRACVLSGHSEKKGLFVDAITFLVNCQAPDGRWFSEDGTRDGDLTVTGICLLSLMGHGHTHRVGKWKKVFRAGITFLMNQMDENGNFSNDSIVQAICAHAACEFWAISRDYSFKPRVIKAKDNVIARQLPDGGFPASAGEKNSEPKATFYSMLAIKASRLGKLTGWEESNKRILEYMDNSGILADESKPAKSEQELLLTAMASLSGIFCNRKRSHPSIQGAWQVLSENPPSPDGQCDIEYFFWGTYSLFQCGGWRWRTWCMAMNPIINNRHKGGNLKGSWDPVMGPLSEKYGRIYTTAMFFESLVVSWRCYSR